MITHLYLSVIISVVVAAAVANAEIKVVCGKDAVKIIWRINQDLVPYAARLFLGSCMPSQLKVMPSGEGEAHFNYKLSDCKFKRMMKGKHIIFQNQLTYRPQAKTKPAAYVHPIECVYKRPEVWTPPFLNPGSGVSEGHSGLVFHMALLNELRTSIAKTNIVPMGSIMPIWAAVEQKSHQPLLLLMEECVAATTPELQPGTDVSPIITNKGCLLESLRGNSKFLPRYHSSALVFTLQSFKFGLGEVYIHCKLLAWDPEMLDETKKACHYVKDTDSWELLDNPYQSSICSCCSTKCSSRLKRGVEWVSLPDSHSLTHTSVLGPLIIVEQSDPRANITLSPESEASKDLLELN